MYEEFDLSEEIWQNAITEVVKSLQTDLKPIITEDRDEDTKQEFVHEAEEILSNRIRLLQKENQGFLQRLKKAKVKNHLTSLLEGHYKGLRHQLRIEPGGLSKPTAKLIVKELFNLKD